MERVARRDTNPYGKSMAEHAQILHHFATVEPRVHWAATAEIDATIPVAGVLSELEAIGSRTDSAPP